LARKRKSKPSNSRRGEKQRVKDRIAHAMDDAQRLDILQSNVVPEESLKPERVDPSVQSEQRFPALVRRAINHGWATPDDKKPGLVDELVELIEDPEATPMAKIFAFNALVKGDQAQHEKDQQYIRLDRVLEMWRGVLEAIRARVQDQALVKLIVADVLRFLPAPSGQVKLINGTTVDGVEGRDDQPTGFSCIHE
jgi:hypothetical protein